MSKTLVAYFSASGTTARVAEQLVQAVAADTVITEGKVRNGRQTAASLKAWAETIF